MNTTTIQPVTKDLLHMLQHLLQHTVPNSSPAVRIVLVGREELRFPASSAWTVRILSGTAWISCGGKDFYPAGGEQLAIPAVKHGAIISAAGHAALLFEIRKKKKNPIRGFR